MLKRIKRIITKILAPDYDEIKDINNQLRGDIYALIMEPKSEYANIVRNKYYLNIKLIDSFWYGDIESDKKCFEGLKSNYMD